MLPLSRPGSPIIGLSGHKIYAGCAKGQAKDIGAEIVTGKPVAGIQVTAMCRGVRLGPPDEALVILGEAGRGAFRRLFLQTN